MRFFFKLLFLLLLLSPFALAAAVFLAVEKSPAVTRDVTLSPDEVQRAKELFAQHDPRKLQDGEVKTVVVSQSDLDLAFNYLVDLAGNGNAKLTADDGSATLLVTLRIPENPLGRYVNVQIEVLEGSGIPKVDYVRVGKVPVPGFVANFLLRRALDKFYGAQGTKTASDLVRETKFSNSRLEVTYEWDSQITDAVRGVLVSAADQERLAYYNEYLVTFAAESGDSVSFATLLQQLFEVAAARSQGAGAAAENRAVILLLSTYVNDRGIQRLAPDSANWPQPVRREVTLGGRKDFAQHFVTSAALSAMGGSAISDAIGLFKEVDDSRGGSGFSFNDLCADLAGTRFGDWATTPARVAKIQSGLADMKSERDIMPDVTGLPEHMPEAEFLQQFGGIGAPKYEAMVTEIEQRVASLPLYR
jgi:uncharacterized protein YfiM (DUF2279 family)